MDAVVWVGFANLLVCDVLCGVGVIYCLYWCGVVFGFGFSILGFGV